MADDDAYGDRTELAHEPPRPPSRPAPAGAPPSAPISRAPPHSDSNTATPSDTWSDDPWDRTSHAREGAQLARALEQRLARWRSEGAVPRRVVVQEPEERTGGGVRARLPIALVADDRRKGAVVIGWVDPTAFRIELKAYAAIDAQHRARFGQPWDVSGSAHAALAHEVTAVARDNGLGIHVLEGDGGPERPPRPAREADVPRWVWVALGVLIGVVAAWAAVKL